LNQIIKFSNERKLSQELKNYRRFVRFKLPYAARMSTRALAWDSNGATGVVASQATSYTDWSAAHTPHGIGENRRSFGVLVADLVDAELAPTIGASGAVVSTLISQIVDFARVHAQSSQGELPEVGTSQLEGVCRGLFEHFHEGLRLWQKIPAEEHSSYQQWLAHNSIVTLPNYGQLVKELFRIESTREQKTFSDSIAMRLTGVIQSRKRAQLFQILEALSETSLLRDARGKKRHLNEATIADLVGRTLDDIGKSASEHPTPDEIFTCNHACIPAVIHGDMNCRNLVWSAAFDKFFAIDFEHTSYGLRGVDQWRLVISTIVEIIPEAIKGWRAPKVADRDSPRRRLVASVCEALVFLDDLTDFICSQHALIPATSAMAQDRWREGGSGVSSVTQVVSAILATLDPGMSSWRSVSASIGEKNGGGDSKVVGWIESMRKDNHKNMCWSMMALCAAAKEFEYALDDLDDECVDHLVKVSKQCNLSRSASPTSARPEHSRDGSTEALPSSLGFDELLELTVILGPSDNAGSHRVEAIARLLVSYKALLVTVQVTAPNSTSVTSAARVRRNRKSPS
jgi:hypothetical protein